MCPYRDWLSTYELQDFSVALMSNDAQCNVVGIGTILTKTHIVRTLSNVDYIPTLNCNLISHGTLKSNGCRYLAEGGVLKVSEDALALIKGCGA